LPIQGGKLELRALWWVDGCLEKWGLRANPQPNDPTATSKTEGGLIVVLIFRVSRVENVRNLGLCPIHNGVVFGELISGFHNE
jgi:hypothetical protein